MSLCLSRLEPRVPIHPFSPDPSRLTAMIYSADASMITHSLHLPGALPGGRRRKRFDGGGRFDRQHRSGHQLSGFPLKEELAERPLSLHQELHGSQPTSLLRATSSSSFPRETNRCRDPFQTLFSPRLVNLRIINAPVSQCPWERRYFVLAFNIYV